MKTLLITFLILSNTAFAAEQKFNCAAKYIFSEKKSTALNGTITSETSLADVNYSIEDETEFQAHLLTKAKNAYPKYAFYQEFKINGGKYTLYMPDRMDNTEHFTAIVENAKSIEKLECFVED